MRARIFPRQFSPGLSAKIALGAGHRAAKLGADQVAGVAGGPLPAVARSQGRGDVVCQHLCVHPRAAVHRLSRRLVYGLVGCLLPVDVRRVFDLANPHLRQCVLPRDPGCAPRLFHNSALWLGARVDGVAADGDRQLCQLHGGGTGMALVSVVSVPRQEAGLGQDHARIPHWRTAGPQAAAPGRVAAILAGGGRRHAGEGARTAGQHADAARSGAGLQWLAGRGNTGRGNRISGRPATR